MAFSGRLLPANSGGSSELTNITVVRPSIPITAIPRVYESLEL
jgi:hypothetical protein